MIFDRFDSRTSSVLRIVMLALIVWSVVGASSHPAGDSGRGLAVTILLAAAAGAWLVWLRHPHVDSAVGPELWVMAAAGGGLVGASPSSAGSAFVFVASVATALRVDLARAMWVISVGTLALALSVLVWDPHGLALLLYALGFLAIALAASNARQYRLRAEQAEVLLAQSQRSREEALRAARLEESTWLAREIHDVLAHSLAGLTIQLEATSALIEKGADPDQILARVRRAHELARDGLRETRRAVGALRDEEVPLAEALEALAAGDSAALNVRGDLARLRGELGRAVLRVIQESLTNVAKHAPGTAVTISIEIGAEAVVTVEDRWEGTPVPAGPLASSGGGYGIAGMRERARALGGTLEAGPTEHGWRVCLRVPLDAAQRPPAAGAAATPAPGTVAAAGGEWKAGT